MSEVNVSFSPIVLFEPTTEAAVSDWFYVVENKSDLPPVVNGTMTVIPVHASVVSTGINNIINTNKLQLEIQTGPTSFTKYDGTFTSTGLKSIGFFRVRKPATVHAVGASVIAYGQQTVIDN
jgi:hypothetical protein